MFLRRAAQSAKRAHAVLHEKMEKRTPRLPTKSVTECRAGKYRSPRKKFKSAAFRPHHVPEKGHAWTKEESPLSVRSFHRGLLRRVQGELRLFSATPSLSPPAACRGKTCLRLQAASTDGAPHGDIFLKSLLLQTRLRSFRGTKNPACPQTPADRLVQLRKRRGGYGVTPAVSGIRGC